MSSKIARLVLQRRVVEMIRQHARDRFMRDSYSYWRRLIKEN
ncbi:MAG: hypothetical protein VX294_05265 [Candidatus Latescibacterota bacterium]|nr:hypothetical protein [Candidatus Latescibacterota bacterium]